MSSTKLFLPVLTLIGLLFFSGCGESRSNVFQKTALGEAVSIVNSDSNATMAPAPSTLKSITSNLAKIVEADVNNENQKDATSFTKEMRYCDVSGVKEFEHQGSVEKMNKLENFDNCKNTQNTQNGSLTFNYEQLDGDGKYPKVVKITVEKEYTFNDILLKKGTKIESKITYKSNKTLKSISLKVNGVVTYQYGTYSLINDQDTITL